MNKKTVSRMGALAILAVMATGCASDAEIAAARERCAFAMSLARTRADSLVVGTLNSQFITGGARPCGSLLRLP